MVRRHKERFKHEVISADAWVSGFFPENNGIQELGKAGIPVVHRVPGCPRAQIGELSCRDFGDSPTAAGPRVWEQRRARSLC